jgi:hypothetical protein
MDTRLYQISYVPPQQTALSSDVAEGDTTISVDDASTISPADTTDYYLYVRGEFMALESTDETNDTATVTRGALGTSPREHSAGQDVYGGVIDADGTDSRELRHIDEINNPDIKEIGDIEQNLEYEKAKFRISNCSVTINGLPKDRLRDAGSVHRPWVFEVVDGGGTVVFSGIVDGESVSYTASSRNTSFDVLSWLELLDRAGSVPARDVFEVEVYGTARTEDEDSAFIDENFGDIQIKLNNEASLVGDVAQVGDVAVIETEESEIRKQIVLREVDDDDRVVIFINSKEEGEGENDVVRKVPGGGSFSTNLSAARLGRTGSQLRIRLTNNQEVFDLVEAVNGDISGMSTGATKNISVPEGFSVEVDLQYEVVYRDRGGNVSEREDRTATTALNEIEVHATNDGYFIEFSNPFDDTINTGPRSDVPVDDVQDGGYRARVKRDSTQRLAEDLTSDSTVRILGQQIYGYEGFPTTIPAYYQADEIVKNIFQIEAANTTGRPQLGVLPYVFDAAAYDSVNNFDGYIGGLPIDPRVEFPDDPLKALRQIQQRQQFLLKERFNNRTNSEGDAIPGYYTEYIYRDSFFDTAVEVSERKVKEWTENVSENDLRAVIVRPNEEYLKGRAGPDVDERIGFYFEGIKRYEDADAEILRDRMTPPDGRNVLEIEMPIIPSDEIGFKYRGEDTVENNPKIKAVAKFFYEHFTKASREVEITFGNDDPEWIGGYWYFKNQGEVIDDYVFVTQETKNVDSTSIDTTLKGRIGQEAATIEDAPPTAIIKGPKEISQANSAGDVQVILNGDDSFSLSGNILSYTWERKEVGGSFSEVQTTGNILRDTISGVDVEKTYIYRLTVTDDATGSTDSVTHEVTVAPARTTPTPQPKNQTFDVKTWQQEGDGVLEVIPDQFYSLDKVEKRSKVGGNIDKGQRFTEISRFQVDVASIDTTNDEVVLTGDYEEHFQKPFLYAKEDDAGGTTLFDISDATYDSGANETTISLAESIDSTRFDAVETGTFVMRVALSTKHTSAIEIRTTGAVDGTRQTQTHTFDFDNLAEVDASVYNDESGAVYADVRGDEDTDNFDLEYRKNGGTWQSVLTGQTTSIVGYEVLAGDQVSDGDNVEVRITPYNAAGEQGRQIARATFYNRSTDGGAQFDGVTINGAGTIDSVNTGEFRLLDESNNDAAVLDVFGIELEQINGVTVGNYARTDQNETFTGDVTIQSNLYVQGTETITNTETLDIATNLGVLNAGETNAGVTKGYAGYEVDRGTLAPFRWIFDEGGDRFRIGQWYKTLSHGSVTNGPFQENERVFGQTSGAEAYIWRVGSGEIDVKRRTGSFDVAGGETIEGETSGATATLTGRETTDDTQAVATREDSPSAGELMEWDNPNSRLISSDYTTDDFGALAENEQVTGRWTFDGLLVDGMTDAKEDSAFNVASIFNIHDGGSKSIQGNAYWNGADSHWEYTGSGGAWLFPLRDESPTFQVAPSGNDGETISWTNVLTLDHTGDVYIPNGYFGVGINDPIAPIHTNGGIRADNPGSAPTGSNVEPAGSPGGYLGAVYEVGDGAGGSAQRWDIRAGSDFFSLYDNDNAWNAWKYNQPEHRLELQPRTNGGSVGLRFRSNANTGSDYARIRFYDDQTMYERGGTGDERSLMLLESQNDKGGSGIGDHIALKSAGSIWLDANPTGNGGDVLMKSGDILSDSYTSGWSGSDNYYPRSGQAELDALSVRGTLLARELEFRKLRFSKGPRADTVGGGKVSAIPVGPTEDGSGEYYWELVFEEEHGLQFDDMILTQETSTGADAENSDGTKGGVAVVRQVRAKVTNVNSTKRVTVYAVNNLFKVSEANYNYADPQIGDDVMVIGNYNDSARDSLIYYDPYGPFIDVLDGIRDFGDWDSRSPKMRLGYLDNIYGVTGEYGIGAGDSTTTGDYFVATPNKVEVDGGIFAQRGAIEGYLLVGDQVKIGQNLSLDEGEQIKIGETGNTDYAKYGIQIRGGGHPDGTSRKIDLLLDDDDYAIASAHLDGNNFLKWGMVDTWNGDLGILARVNGNAFFSVRETGVGNLADWNFDNTTLYRDNLSSSDIDVKLGRAFSDRFGLAVITSSYELNTVAREPEGPEMSLYNRDTGDFEFRLGHTNQIAGWGFDDKTLDNTTNGFQVNMGVMNFFNDRYGFGFEDTTSQDDQPQGFFGVRQDSNSVGMYVSQSENDFVSIGNDWYRGGKTVGMTVRADGNYVFETDGSTAYMDYMEVRSNATIKGKLFVGDDRFARVKATGTSFAPNAGGASTVLVDGEQVAANINTGLFLVVFDSDLSIRHTENFDVAFTSGRGQDFKDTVTGAVNLNDGSPINEKDLCVVVSYDAVTDQQPVKDALDHIGASGKEMTKERNETGGNYNDKRMTVAIVGQANGVPSSGNFVIHGADDERRAYAVGWYTGDQVFGPKATNAVIDGSIVVDGTVKAQQIDTQDLYSVNAQVTGTLTIGDGSGAGAIKSENFDGSQGWRIQGDNATFENGTFRGTVNAEGGSLADLELRGQLTFPSTYDTSQIRIGSGADAFFVGDFRLSGSGQGSGSPDMADSASNSNLYGGSQTSSNKDSYFNSSIGGASVSVDVDWDSSSTSSDTYTDIDPLTGVSVEIIVRELSGGTVLTTRSKTDGSINYSGTISFAFTADSSTDEIEVETNLSATLGEDEQYYDSVSISNNDANVDWTNEQDFVGPDGAIWRDNGETRVKIDGGDSLGAKDDRIVVQEGRVTIRDSSGNDVISIQSNGLIVFHQNRGRPSQADMDYGQACIYALDAGGGNVNLGWLEDSGKEDAAF